MEMVKCACGCEELRPRFDKKGRERRYVAGHQNRKITERQRAAFRKNMKSNRPTEPWNKGKSYVFKSKQEYANKGSWNKALRRLYADRCMICGWDKASCDTHHINPRSNGGKYTIENGVILCPNCHRLADIGVLAVEELKQAKSIAKMIGAIV